MVQNCVPVGLRDQSGPLDLIGRGAFRADLYYRIAGFVCKLPPLRERLEDIIPLAEYFLRQVYPNGQSAELDAAVREYLL